MPSKSKEDQVLRLILENSPLREWHFEEIVRESKVTRAVANKWLTRYVEEGLLKKVKEKMRFSYFTVGTNNSIYYSRKKLYVLEQFHYSGLIPKLLSLNVKTIIFFGSMIKGDWYKKSDIDILVYGDDFKLDLKMYERKLGRHIEVHHFEDRKEIEDVQTGLIANVINGYVIKGSIQDIVEIG